MNDRCSICGKITAEPAPALPRSGYHVHTSCTRAMVPRLREVAQALVCATHQRGRLPGCKRDSCCPNWSPKRTGASRTSALRTPKGGGTT